MGHNEQIRSLPGVLFQLGTLIKVQAVPDGKRVEAEAWAIRSSSSAVCLEISTQRTVPGGGVTASERARSSAISRMTCCPFSVEFQNESSTLPRVTVKGIANGSRLGNAFDEKCARP